MSDVARCMSIVRSIAKNIAEIYGPTAELLAVYAKILGIRPEQVSFLSKDHIDSIGASRQITVLISGSPLCTAFGSKTYHALQRLHTEIACLIVKAIEEESDLESLQKKAIRSYAAMHSLPDESVEISMRIATDEWICTLSSLDKRGVSMSARKQTQREALQDLLGTLRFNLCEEKEKLMAHLHRIEVLE